MFYVFVYLFLAVTGDVQPQGLFFAGVKTEVEAPKKNPFGRPRKRPKGVEDLVSSERPEVTEAIGKLRKPEPLVSMAHQVVLEEVFEECFPVDGEEQHQGEEPRKLLKMALRGRNLLRKTSRTPLKMARARLNPLS